MWQGVICDCRAVCVCVVAVLTLAMQSTLIKLLVGELEPVSGTASRNRHTRIEYIAQHQVEQLDLHSTPLDFIASLYPGNGGREHLQNLRGYLATFGLGGDVLPKQRIHTLSGGQKCRLCLACSMYRKPHLLVLVRCSVRLCLDASDTARLPPPRMSPPTTSTRRPWQRSSRRSKRSRVACWWCRTTSSSCRQFAKTCGW